MKIVKNEYLKTLTVQIFLADFLSSIEGKSIGECQIEVNQKYIWTNNNFCDVG